MTLACSRQAHPRLQASEAAVELARRGDDQAAKLQTRLRACLDGAPPCHLEYADRLDDAAAPLRDRRRLAGEHQSGAASASTVSDLPR